MEKSQVFRINSPQVVCETIDGEVVIVNLDKGIYYSLLKTGADVWTRIERKLDRQSLIQELVQAYDGTIEEITVAVDQFIANLQQEELIVEFIANLQQEEPIVVDSTAEAANIDNSTDISAIANKPRFEQPLLEKFTDMEDLLLLDPIHEVDVEAGWPNAKTT